MKGDEYESQLLTSAPSTATNSLNSPLTISPPENHPSGEESSFLAEAMVVPTTRRNAKFRAKSVGFEESEDLTDVEKATIPSNGQLKIHRLSLHGKPINIRQHRQDARLRRMQVQIYNFLERPRGWKAGIYHTLVFLMVLFCLVLSVLSTVPDYMDVAAYVLMKVEIILVIWFSFEYFCRIWSAGCRSRYQGWMGRFRTMTSPFCIIDVVVIIASMVVLSLGGTGQVFAASAIRGLRFFQILRMVRIDRRGGSWKLLGTVVWAHRQELITTMYIGFLGLIFASFLVYLCEKNVNVKFSTFADALWWGVITLCTVGYGDKVPSTWMGKIIASFCALLGISFFALPAGILGSGFALKVQQQQRQKHITRRRVPAASLIQCRWRLYASDENSLSEATWKIHVGHNPPPPAFKPSTAAFLGSRFARMSLRSPLRKGDVDVNKLGDDGESSSRRRSSQSTRKGRWKAESLKAQTSDPSEMQPATVKRRLCLSLSQENHDSQDYNQSGMLGDKLATTPHRKKPSFSYYSEDENTDENPVKKITELTPEWKNLIRFIRRLKYMVSRRKFKEALKPYDVKDVIEQYSAGHVDLLARVKSLQNRLDVVLGNPNTVNSKGETKIGLAQRVVKMERQIDDIEGKLDILIRLSLGDKGGSTGDLSSPGSAYSSTEVLSACNSNESVRKAPLKSILSKPKSDQPDPLQLRNTLIVPSMFDSREKKRVSLCHSAGEIEELRGKSASPLTDKRIAADLEFHQDDMTHKRLGRPDSLHPVTVKFGKSGDSANPGVILTPNTLSVNL